VYIPRKMLDTVYADLKYFNLSNILKNITPFFFFIQWLLELWILEPCDFEISLLCTTLYQKLHLIEKLCVFCYRNSLVTGAMHVNLVSSQTSSLYRCVVTGSVFVLVP